MRVCVPQHCLSPLSLQPLSKRWRWGEGKALSHLVNAKEAKDVHYYDFYGKSSVCFGPLQGPVLAPAMSNNLQFYWQRIVKLPIITPPLCHICCCLFSPFSCFFPHTVFIPCTQVCVEKLDFFWVKWMEQDYSSWGHGSTPAHHLQSKNCGPSPAPRAQLALTPGGCRLEQRTLPWHADRHCAFAVLHHLFQIELGRMLDWGSTCLSYFVCCMSEETFTTGLI